MSNVFGKSIEISDGVIMEAYDNGISFWDNKMKCEIMIDVDKFDFFIKEFKQMSVELMVYRAGVARRNGMITIPKGMKIISHGNKSNISYNKNKEMSLESEIMLDKLSDL